MQIETDIVNRVMQSNIAILNPEDWKPTVEIVSLDIKAWLFMEMILKEKDFREFVKNHDWAQYKNKAVAVYCSADAIVPAWAYMLIATKLSESYYFSLTLPENLYLELYKQNLNSIDFESFEGRPVVLKGCGNTSALIYLELTKRLQPFAKTIMFGEPCSTVPIFKSNKRKEHE